MTYTQDGRPLAIRTPLGKDKLFLIGVSGYEGISRLFRFQLEVLAENKTEVAFEELLGKAVTVELELPTREKRYFNGIVSKVLEEVRGLIFTEYTLEMVPQFWLLTRRAQSRIFQQIHTLDDCFELPHKHLEASKMIMDSVSVGSVTHDHSFFRQRSSAGRAGRTPSHRSACVCCDRPNSSRWIAPRGFRFTISESESSSFSANSISALLKLPRKIRKNCFIVTRISTCIATGGLDEFPLVWVPLALRVSLAR